jgi:hypothetical protein
MSDNKKTMTLNLTEREMEVLEELSGKKELSKTAVIRQALRLFQLVDLRLAQGAKLVLEDERANKKAELENRSDPPGGLCGCRRYSATFPGSPTTLSMVAPG